MAVILKNSSDVTQVLGISGGGTGAITAAAARTNLGLSTNAISLSFTKTSGGTLSVQNAYLYGNVVHARISVTAASAVSAGGNLWVGTLTNYKPVTQVIAPSYYDNLIQLFNIQSDGSVTVRGAVGSFPSGGTTTFGFTWLIA